MTRLATHGEKPPNVFLRHPDRFEHEEVGGGVSGIGRNRAHHRKNAANVDVIDDVDETAMEPEEPTLMDGDGGASGGRNTQSEPV